MVEWMLLIKKKFDHSITRKLCLIILRISTNPTKLKLQQIFLTLLVCNGLR
jgi:hypothetical protein